jgi:hypothetical protein
MAVFNCHDSVTVCTQLSVIAFKFSLVNFGQKKAQAKC